MKASELKQGETYGTVWGYEVEFVGEWKHEPSGDVRYEFKTSCGRSYLTAENVEKFVSKTTVEISVKRLDEIMRGVTEREDVIDEALRAVNSALSQMDWVECGGAGAYPDLRETLTKLADILER